MSPMVACAVTTGVVGFIAVFCDVVPALAFQTSDGFPSVFVGLALFVANEKAVCNGPIG